MTVDADSSRQAGVVRHKIRYVQQTRTPMANRRLMQASKTLTPSCQEKSLDGWRQCPTVQHTWTVRLRRDLTTVHKGRKMSRNEGKLRQRWRLETRCCFRVRPWSARSTFENLPGRFCPASALRRNNRRHVEL